MSPELTNCKVLTYSLSADGTNINMSVGCITSFKGVYLTYTSFSVQMNDAAEGQVQILT